MGDRSPKSTQKRAGQKEVRSKDARQKKKDAVDAKRKVLPNK